MARTENDTWDLTSSVGGTATLVAAARALASVEAHPIINDPFAAPLVRAVGLDFFTRLVDGEITAEQLPADRAAQLQQLTTSLAVRTRFFDDFFLDACSSGVRQAVILAAGLDSRGYRLSWPAGITVYEIDQPDVIDFKTDALAVLGAQPAAQRRTVGVDLRDDWPSALRGSGFDDTQPAAWSAEGLLMYLPPEAQDQLFDDVTALSAPGSRLATEYHADAGHDMAEHAQALTAQWREYGYNLDMAQLLYLEERSDVRRYLADRGWQVTARPRRELYAQYGRQFPDDDPLASFRDVISISAVRG